MYLALNYALLVTAYLWLFRTRKRSTAIGSTTGRSHALGAHFSVENRLSTAIMVKFASLSLRYIAMLLASCATRNMEHVPAPKTPAPLASRPYVNDDAGHLASLLVTHVDTSPETRWGNESATHNNSTYVQPLSPSSHSTKTYRQKPSPRQAAGNRKLKPAVPSDSAGISSAAMPVSNCAFTTTPAATATARSAGPWPRSAGLPPGALNYCPCHTSIWYSRCRMN